MIGTLIARRLIVYALYTAAVTALPVLSATPAARVALPAFRAEADSACADCRCETCAPSYCIAAEPVLTVSDCDPFWRRGPVRRAARAVACFLSRPWRG